MFVFCSEMGGGRKKIKKTIDHSWMEGRGIVYGLSLPQKELEKMLNDTTFAIQLLALQVANIA